MESLSRFLQMDSRTLRLSTIALLLLVNSIAGAPGSIRNTKCLIQLQESGEISEQSLAEFERCRANYRFHVNTRTENHPASSHERSDDVSLKCLLVVEAAKTILEPEVYERLRSCYEDRVCSRLMGPCESPNGQVMIM